MIIHDYCNKGKAKLHPVHSDSSAAAWRLTETWLRCGGLTLQHTLSMSLPLMDYLMSSQVSETVGLMLTLLIASTAGKSVTTKMENHMTEAITRMIDNMTDSNGMRFMVSGIVRLCFHDCVVKCDGCIDMRRKFQPGNNGESKFKGNIVTMMSEGTIES